MATPRRRTKDSLENTVGISARVHESTYNFLRDQAYVQRKSMNLILEECIQRYKKMLTGDDVVIS